MYHTKEILKKLVSMQFVSGTDNSEIVDYVSSFMEECGLKVTKYTNPKYPHSNSIVAQTDIKDMPSIVFSGHMDIFPPEIEGDHTGKWCHSDDVSHISSENKGWMTPPNKAIEKDGMIYGRGTSDMLGGIATLMNFAKTVKKENLQKNLVFVFTDDEENGMNAIQHILPQLLSELSRKKQNPEGCIVFEGTEMNPVVGQKGSFRANIHVQGLQSHIARPDLGVDSFKYAIDAYNYLSRLCEKEKMRWQDDERFIPPRMHFTASSMDNEAVNKRTIGRSTLSVNISYLPYQDIKNVLSKFNSYIKILNNKIKQRDEACSILTEIIADARGFMIEEESPFLQSIIRSSKKDIKMKGVSFDTEAKFFNAAGIPSVVLGPGTTTTIHSPNEYVKTEKLAEADLFLANYYINSLSRPPLTRDDAVKIAGLGDNCKKI